jgi:hypothetical protein
VVYIWRTVIKQQSIKHKMKKLFGLMVFSLITVSVMAQDLVEMVKRDINAERRTIVAEAMEITTENETEFWQIYNEMEKELGILMDKRVGNINKFADNYENVTEDIAGELAKTYFEIEGGRLKVYKSYYKKVSKLIGKKEASRFIQLLDQIQLIIDMQVAAELPLIE